MQRKSPHLRFLSASGSLLARRSASLCALTVAVLGASTVAQAKEKPPLAGANDTCPLDAPVRVASSDTLKRFTVLSACTPDKVIVAPRDEPFVPRPTVRSVPERGAIIAEPGVQYDGMILGEDPPAPVAAGARAVTADLGAPAAASPSRDKGGKRARRAKVGDVTVDRSTVGDGIEVVRIAPHLPELESEPTAPSYAPPAAPANRAVVASAPSGSFAATVLAMRPHNPSAFDTTITDAAVRHSIDPLVLHAVIYQESRYRPQAVSHVGARGLMQIMPGTGLGLGVRHTAHLLDPATNVDAGARYLKQMWTRFGGRFDLVLAAYNAGPGAVIKYGYRVPPYRETQDYVAKVTARYHQLVQENGMGGYLR